MAIQALVGPALGSVKTIPRSSDEHLSRRRTMFRAVPDIYAGGGGGVYVAESQRQHLSSSTTFSLNVSWTSPLSPSRRRFLSLQRVATK